MTGRCRSLFAVLCLLLCQSNRGFNETKDWYVWVMTGDMGGNVHLDIELFGNSNQSVGKTELYPHTHYLEENTSFIHYFQTHSTEDVTKMKIYYDVSSGGTWKLDQILLQPAGNSSEYKHGYLFECNCFLDDISITKTLVATKIKFCSIKLIVINNGSESFANETKSIVGQHRHNISQDVRSHRVLCYPGENKTNNSLRIITIKEFANTMLPTTDNLAMTSYSTISETTVPSTDEPSSNIFSGTETSSTENTCWCPCENPKASSTTARISTLGVTDLPKARKKEIQKMVKEMTVEKKTLSSFVRKKISAKDDRPSSVAIGNLGVVMLAIPFIFIVVTDMISLAKYLLQ